MTRRFDAVVIGGDIDGLVAATELARSGSSVLLVEEAGAPGGSLREIEFASGHRAAPFAPADDASLVALGDGEPIVLQATSSAGLERRCAADARKWPDFSARMRALAGFLGELYRAPAPRIDADSLGELFGLAGLARKYRKLGRVGMTDLLRTLPIPIADLLDDEFETPVLKGALAAFAVMDVAQGPAAAGTAFTFLHRHVAIVDTTRKGSVAAVRAAESAARAAGVTCEMNVAVRAVNVADSRVTGLTLDSGEEIACATVISSLDPYRSLLDLIDPLHHEPEFIHAVRNIRFRGVSSKVLVALDALPAVGPLPLSGTLLIAPSVRDVERAYEAVKYGRRSDEPFIAVQFPTAARAADTANEKHVAVLHVQYTPYQLRDGSWDTMRDGIGDMAIARVDHHLPGFAARVRERTVLTPPDLEARFGVREGAVTQGETMLDQILFMRPVPAAARYATPVAGYFLCGAGTHPGPGVHGVSGRLAARAARSGA